MFGGQIGYRWQAGQWVFGLEAQGDWANLRNSRDSLRFRGKPGRATSMDWVSSRVRLATAGMQALLYFKGGAAVANARNDLFTTVGGVGIASAERTAWGGTVGVGWEYGFSPNWTAGIEYDYLFRTNNSNTFLTPTLTPVTAVSVNTRSDVNMITARINYRFGGPAVPHY